MSDFKDKKTKKNKSKIVEFKTKSLKEQKIETNQDIWNKMDSYAKELVEAFDEKTNRENIDRDHCLYLFHYRLMQKMMFKMSYPAFKYYTRSVSKQLLEHHKEFMNSLQVFGDVESSNSIVIVSVFAIIACIFCFRIA